MPAPKRAACLWSKNGYLNIATAKSKNEEKQKSGVKIQKSE